MHNVKIFYMLFITLMLCFNISRGESQKLVISQPDTFNYKTSENITRDYFHFLKKQNIDTILIFYTSEGKSIKYINITNFIYLKKGNAYMSFHTTYPIDSRKKGQIYFVQNRLLSQLDENKIENILGKISGLSEMPKNEDKPFNNMWRKRKWRKLYLFGIDSANQEDIYDFKASGIYNRSYRNTQPASHSLLFKHKRQSIRIYKLLKSYIIRDLNMILGSK